MIITCDGFNGSRAADVSETNLQNNSLEHQGQQSAAQPD